MKIELHTPDGKIRHRYYSGTVRIKDIADSVQSELPYEILTARVNRHSCRLSMEIHEDCMLELLDLRSSEANMVYQASLKMLYLKAVHDVLGKDVQIVFNNSLSKGIFTIIRKNNVTPEACARIEQRMHDLSADDFPFEEQKLSREEFTAFARAHKRLDQEHLAEYAPDLREAKLFRLLDEEEISYEELVPDTSYLKLFEVRRYKNGVLLRFPHPSKPDEVPPFAEQPLLYGAFSEATRWDRIMGVNYAADLNEMIADGEINDLVLLSEALHEKKIAEIAEMIHASGKRIVLIAGPSSSGKTTFAKRLCIQLRVAGLRPLYLGTDDYFLERDETPVGPDGKKDFEGLAALDIDLFNTQMNALLSGKKVDLPRFDFPSGKKVYGERITSIADSQPVVIEGLHCLNPALTPYIPKEQKFLIYISPLTQLNIDMHNRIPTTDARMLRRIVRDARFRNLDAAATIDMWPKVKHGEDNNIFPYNGNADVFFNSSSLYELSVLKKYAQPQLEAIDDSRPEYAEAQRLLRFLQFFRTMEDDSIIPNNSILREFIGGSVIVH